MSTDGKDPQESPQPPDLGKLSNDPDALKHAHARYGGMLQQTGLPFEPDEFDDEPGDAAPGDATPGEAKPGDAKPGDAKSKADATDAPDADANAGADGV